MNKIICFGLLTIYENTNILVVLPNQPSKSDGRWQKVGWKVPPKY